MNLTFVANKVSKVVILAGGQSLRLSPLSRYRPICMFPVFNKPLIEHTINLLRTNGIRDIVIAGSKDNSVGEYINSLVINNSNKLSIQYIEDDKPKGTAGILRGLRDFIDNENFLVINCNTFMGDVDINELIAFHYAKDSVATIGVKKSSRFLTEGINVSADGLVNGFHAMHSSREKRSSLKTVGIYVFRPDVIEFINGKGYFDIKEQLIPALKKASLPIYSHNINGYCKVINTINDYYNTHREGFLNGMDAAINMTEIGDGIWIGENVSISPKSYIFGPVIIGSGCTINDNAQIIGPTVIGNGCKVGKSALVRESILWEDSVIEDGSSVSYCITGPKLKIRSGEIFRNKVVVDNLMPEDISLPPLKHLLDGMVKSTASNIRGFKYTTSLSLKRLMDILFSSAGLILFLPFWLFIASIIKLDSKGPVLFHQKRCGKNGKDFEMLKFRTMVEDAENRQQQLSSKKDVDGPMFKLVNDPRITRVGRFLRKTSLDEIPQLINVLKGEMSLVGPRPLVMSEMKFSPSWRDARLKVKPGVTGLWQIQGRSDALFHDWIRYDVDYVKNQSLWLDLKILFKTIKVVLKRVGAV